MVLESDDQLAHVVAREASRLRRFIRRRVDDPRDVEDILQEVFAELVEANRRLMPIDQITGWLFRVARNRIIDLFRRRRPEESWDAVGGRDDGEALRLDILLASVDADPEAVYLRRALFEEFDRALDELPREQREVFVAHEFDGQTFKEIAAATGVNLNTLLSRKRYAVLQLRERMQRAFDEFTSNRGTGT